MSAIGLAVRAGRARAGYEAVSRTVRKGEAVAVLVAGDAPAQVRNKLERLLGSSATPYRVALDGDRLGRAMGRERVVALAVTDGSLGRRVIELADELKS